MEFLSLDGMCRLLRSSGWSKRDVLRAVESGQLAAYHIKSDRGRNKLAILHPGVQFLDYLRDPLVRMGHIGILSDQDVSVILGKSRSYVRWLVHKKRLKPIPNEEKSRNGRRLRFTPESVRRYIILSTGRDPKERREPTAEVLVDWFWRLMKTPPSPDPVELVDDDIRRLDELPEPERSHQIEKLLRLAEDARRKIIGGEDH